MIHDIRSPEFEAEFALRHPANKGRAAGDVREFVNSLIDRVLRAGLEAGFNPQHDVANGG